MGTSNLRVYICVMAVSCALFGWPLNDAQGQSISQGPSFGGGLANSQLQYAFSAYRIDDNLPAVQIGYTDTPRMLRAGYTGLVLPGTCVSSYFVYSLKGISLAASVPVHVGGRLFLLLKGSYLAAANGPANQDITWLDMPPGARHWNQSRSSLWGLQGEFSYRICEGSSLLGGIRWESLTSRFWNPTPDYPFTVADMESGLSLGLYQPFLGLRLEQGFGSGRSLLRVIGFPVMAASLEHFNTCNNQGVPFAHVGASQIRNGYFLEVHGEMRMSRVEGVEAAGYITWELYRGQCAMNLERRDAGPPVSVSSDVVDFSYDRSSLTVGAKIIVPFALPF
jgi:hypothetical protein